MKGVKSIMELILIITCATAASLLIILNYVKPVQKTELSQLASVDSMTEVFKQIDAVKAIAVNNETKIQTLNTDLLNEIARASAEIDGIEAEIDLTQEHIARLRESVQVNDRAIDSIDSEIAKAVNRFAKPMLVKLIQDKNLRTYTIEKVKRTKTGYEKRSLSRIVKGKKKEKIKKLNLPGVTEAKESFVQTGL